ncbi:MAG TPA: hypothetical protein VK615_06685, partial [Candidatus Binatia bacterium]|nr:hypothetical protein [Candidatus Binatia bacterium]
NNLKRPPRPAIIWAALQYDVILSMIAQAGPTLGEREQRAPFGRNKRRNPIRGITILTSDKHVG